MSMLMRQKLRLQTESKSDRIKLKLVGVENEKKVKHRIYDQLEFVANASTACKLMEHDDI